jgi:uncharacterized protein
MEVLRESLEVLAATADERLGRPAKPLAAPMDAVPAGGDFECFYFGSQQSLYGVFHGGGSQAPRRALLICAPLGQETVRSHFILHKVSRQLAARGVPVLRFDYFGSGNSLGADVDGNCARWSQDILEACRELKKRTPGASIFALGARIGATFLWSVSRELDIERILLWDPVANGLQYLNEMQSLHRARLRSLQDLRLGRRPHDAAGGKELLGFTYSDRALGEMRSLQIQAASELKTPVDWIASQPHAQQRALFSTSLGHTPGARFKALDHDCLWSDATSVEDVLPDVGFSDTILNLVQTAFP